MILRFAIGAIVAACCALAAAQSNTPPVEDQASTVAVARARALLDNWTGQPAVLRDAKADIDAILQKNPNDPRALKELARYEIMSGYVRNRAVARGRIVYSVGEYGPETLLRASAHLIRATAMNPKFAEGYVLLGYVLTEEERPNDAIQMFERAEAIGTDDPWLQLNWASALQQLGDDAGAATRWQSVIDRGTSNTKALTAAYDFLIGHLAKRGEHDKAMALYEENIRRNPDNAWMRGNYAAYLTQEVGKPDEAIEQARKALDIMDYGIGRRTLAEALYAKWADMVAAGKGANAEPIFREAHAIYPDLTDVMVYGASVPTGIPLAKALTTRKKVSIDARTDDGSTALLIAVNRNREKLVLALLDMKANPNVPDFNGWTPLLSAINVGNEEMAKALLAKGADPRATMRGRDAASRADAKGLTEFAKILRARSHQSQ